MTGEGRDTSSRTVILASLAMGFFIAGFFAFASSGCAQAVSSQAGAEIFLLVAAVLWAGGGIVVGGAGRALRKAGNRSRNVVLGLGIGLGMMYVGASVAGWLMAGVSNGCVG